MSDELTVESCLEELREMWPGCSAQIRQEHNAGFDKNFVSHFEIGVISKDYEVHGERFDGPTLNEAMQSVRAFKQSQEQER